MSDARVSLDVILAGATPIQERVAAARSWLDENLRNDPGGSREMIDALLPEALSAGDAAGAAWLRFQLGWLAIDADDFAQGMEILEGAKATFEDLGDREGICRCLNALGGAYLAQGVFDLALDYCRESISEAEKVGRMDLADAASGNLSQCLYELGEPEEAFKVIEHCRMEYTTAPHNIAPAHHQAGQIYRSLGRLEEAERELRDAIGLAGDNRLDRLEAEQALAEVHVDTGHLDEAELLVKAGLEECARTGERAVGTRFRLTRARLAMAKTRIPEAIADIEAAIGVAREIGTRKIEADAEKALYLAWRAQGNCQESLAAFVRHTGLKETMKGEQASRRMLGLHAERARREARHFETLYKQVSTISEIGQRITANLDLDATLETLYESVNSLMAAPTLMIGLVDEERECLDYRLVMIRGQRKEPFSHPLSQESFGCWCINHRSDVLIGDLATEYPQYVHSIDELVFDGTTEKSIIFVPLFVGNKAAGMISVQSHLPNAYDKRKIETVRAIGAYVAIAIENTKLFRQIQRLATIDGLTGLLNRRRLTEEIDTAYQQTRRYRRTTGIIMADVDHFKRVNDTYGHDVGDRVLRAIADAFTEKIRVCDFAGRFGGEEFVIVLPETSMGGTCTLAERLREAVEALEIQIPDGAAFGVTASFGVSTIHPDDSSHESALKRADQALYHAKHSGRNRVSTEAGE